MQPVSAKARALLRLCRPALLWTGPADVLAGAALGGGLARAALVPLARNLLASVFLLGGAFALNDAAGATEDRTKRPERPIPKGEVTRFEAGLLAALLFALALLVADAFLVAAAITALAVGYDLGGRSKSWGLVLPPACRILDMLLGATAHTPTSLPFSALVSLAAYGGFVALAVQSGRLEDRAPNGEGNAPFPFIPVGLALALFPCVFGSAWGWLGLALLAGAAWREGVFKAAGRRARTDSLLRALPRFACLVALAAGDPFAGLLIAIPAYAPKLLPLEGLT